MDKVSKEPHIYTYMLLVFLITITITYQSDIISSIKAMSLQCSTDYVLDLPIPNIENIKNEH